MTSGTTEKPEESHRPEVIAVAEEKPSTAPTGGADPRGRDSRTWSAFMLTPGRAGWKADGQPLRLEEEEGEEREHFADDKAGAQHSRQEEDKEPLMLEEDDDAEPVSQAPKTPSNICRESLGGGFDGG